MEQAFERVAQSISAWAGRPQAFALALTAIILWAIIGPVFGWSDTWQLVINTSTTIITFLMVFLIQNAQNRDAGAIQAKLDELIRAVGEARNEFIGIEHLGERQLDALRRALEQEFGDQSPHHEAIERLIERR